MIMAFPFKDDKLIFCKLDIFEEREHAIRDAFKILNLEYCASIANFFFIKLLGKSLKLIDGS